MSIILNPFIVLIWVIASQAPSPSKRILILIYNTVHGKIEEDATVIWLLLSRLIQGTVLVQNQTVVTSLKKRSGKKVLLTF